MYSVSEDAKKKVYETFGRNEEMVEDDVHIIKTWIKTQPHLPELMEDVKIKNFLNLSKFSIEKTKEKIDMYYTIRSVIPELFESSNPKLEVTKNLFNGAYLFTFPKQVNGVHRVHFSKQKKMNALNPFAFYNVWLSIFEIRLKEDFMVDDYLVTDLDNYSLADMKQINPMVMSKFVAIYKKVYALRLKKVLLLNCPSYVSILSAILKVVVKPKIFDRIEFHQDAEVLKEIICKEELPKEYGGEGPSLDQYNVMMQTKLSEYQDRFDQLDKLKVNENLRPQKLDNDEILGFYGSFKKINID
ncbi:retinol-binding protein pinta-like [Zophobas morio]|uniref:retinol-binding protein pinta-like n=1 Tax=Zophobas morio TaxID=2755281 RepID=UPI003083E59A